MSADKLNIFKRPKLNKPRLVLGFTGWMDSGEVSTGTIRELAEKLDAKRIAEIETKGFYIQSFPGTMETSSMLRPYTRIEDGMVKYLEEHNNMFLCDEKNDMVFFLGKEPNLNWEDFSDCMFSFCRHFGVEVIYFIGSVAGLVPHTREPRLICSVSDENLKHKFESYGIGFSNYEGPASIVTYLMAKAGKHGIHMANFVATVPAYVQGSNLICIESVTRKLSHLLGLDIDLDRMRQLRDEYERRLTEVVQDEPELAENVKKIEENFDNDVFDNEMDDLRKWLQQKGVRLD